MKTKIMVIGLLIAFGAATFGLEADFGAAGARRSEELSLLDMLTYAVQDEYLARAEYELIMAEYGDIRPFTNIKQAEERHIEWVTGLFEAHGYALPADTAGEHVVLPENLRASFEAGIQAEIDNIAMYELFLEREIPGDVRDIFENLKAASENHLRAFRNNLGRYR